MSSEVRKRTDQGPRSVWNATLDEFEHGSPTQAGEVDAGLEDGMGGGDKGIDAETGSGGYGGDAVEAGHDEAASQPERPLDAEIHGDPRTRWDEGFPDEAKRADPDQKPIGESEEIEE